MAATGIFLRRANKVELISDPPLIGEIVFALDTEEYGALISGQIVWRNVFDLNQLIVDVTNSIINDNFTSLTQTYSSEKIQNLHNIQAEAIANLATSQARIINTTTPVFNILATEQQLPFSISVDSTDSNIFTIDDVNNTVTFLKNASYNFISNIILKSSTPSARTITFNLRDNLTNNILTITSGTFDIPNGRTENFSLNTLITVGKNGLPPAPLTIKIGVLADQTGYSFESFSSILASSSSYDINSEASGIHFNPSGNISSTNVQAAIQELDTEKAPILSPNFLGTPTIDARGNVLTDVDYLNGGYF